MYEHRYVLINNVGNYAANIRPEKLPYELLPTSLTLQFKGSNIAHHHSPNINTSHPNPQSKTPSYHPTYLFAVDTCVNQQQLQGILSGLRNVIRDLPPQVCIGLITFNKHVQVYQLSQKLNINYCINGGKEITQNALLQLLGVSGNNAYNNANPPINRFVVNVGEHRERILKRINDIRPDRNIYVNQRSHRCLGQAITIAINLVAISSYPTRVVVLAGGPCTYGPGMTISPNFKCQFRSANELSKGENIPYFVQAKNYYDSLMKPILAKKIIIDLFAFSIQEVGFTQMSQMLAASGGYTVMHQQFKDRIFKESFAKVFPRIQKQEKQSELQLHPYSEAVVMVYCSKDVALNGAIGQCHSLNKAKPFISDKIIGKGKTHAWYLGSIDHLKTITVFYELVPPQTKQQYYFVQWKAIYRNDNGEMVTRVSTKRLEWSASTDSIAQAFDQQAAVVSIARMAVGKVLFEQQKSVRQWIDGCLCRWAQCYANYIKNDQTSFALPPTMKRLPQFLYHLRRSHFINRFGISLDQSFYIGLTLLRQSVDNCLSMIQPALLSYSLQNLQPTPVPLDEQEMKDDVILVLDSYFVVVEWYGQHVNGWYDAGWHTSQEYAHIKELMDSPKIDINDIMASRFPVPNYYRVHPYHSKERYLKSRVNPKKNGSLENENMITDDSDIRAFTQHLIRVVVKST